MSGAFTRAGRTVVAHVQTWRPYTLCYPALLGLAGAATAGAVDRPVAALAPVLGWLSGHYFGDYFDRGLDAIGKPHRPIPSGRLSCEAACAGGFVCAVASGVLLVLANWRILPLFLLAMAGIVGYSKVFKSRGLSGNVVRGVITALALVIGAMVAADWPPWRLVPIAAGFLLHDTASNLIGTVRDVAGDRAGGYRSAPVRYGVRRTVFLALGLYAAGVLLVALGVPAEPHPWVYAGLVLAAALTGAAAFAPPLRAGEAVRARAALRAHELLVGERLVLAIAVTAGAAGPVAALALLPLMVFSLVVQALMRARHEFPPAPVLLRKDPV
jgi:geranylgeranylglycerol-phosphate geranylgeranyltransferase